MVLIVLEGQIRLEVDKTNLAQDYLSLTGLLIFARTGIKTGLAACSDELEHQNLLVNFLGPVRKSYVILYYALSLLCTLKVTESLLI